MSVAAEILERFMTVLVEEIRAKRPEYLEEPFTVAEIYQDLVPYGACRDRIGVEMNGDYENALLRLLAGEGAFLILDSEHALRDLRDELATAHPNTGVYREFAAVDVRLNPAAFVSSRGLPEPSPSRPDDEGAGAPQFVDAPTEESPLPVASASTGNPRVDLDAAPDSAACRWCRAPLPVRTSLRYCPFCGSDVRAVPCAECGEELEPEWRFCIACGAEGSG